MTSVARRRALIACGALLLAVALVTGIAVSAYVQSYPEREQSRLLARDRARGAAAGEFDFSGLIGPEDSFVVTPQATVDYGRAWFSLADGPAVVRTPRYDRFFSVAVYDMRHNVPLVIANPEKPVLIHRPGQALPPGDYHRVELETTLGLVLTRMVVVDNLPEVRRLREAIVMDGGRGPLDHHVDSAPAGVAWLGDALITASLPLLKVSDRIFPRQSGDVGALTLAAAVKIGQLGTPSDTVRYAAVMDDESGEPLNGSDTYEAVVPAGIVREGGYFSVTAYGADDKQLIPNPQRRYDRTTYTAEANADGSYTITLSPAGDGRNGIPTGEPFYLVLRAYLPVADAAFAIAVTRVPQA